MNWGIWRSMRIEAIAHLKDDDIGEVRLLIANSGGIYDVVMVGTGRALKKARKVLDLTGSTFIRRSIFFGYPALIIRSYQDWSMAIQIFTNIAMAFSIVDIDLRLAAHDNTARCPNCGFMLSKTTEQVMGEEITKWHCENCGESYMLVSEKYLEHLERGK